GHPISADLARLGVRWVVLVKDVDWPRYEPGLSNDPDMALRVSGRFLALYEVKSWKGAVVADDGTVVPSSPILSPVEQVDGSGPARAAIPAAQGWLRGFTPISRTSDGIVA